MSNANIARIDTIKFQIKALTEEAVKLADEEKVTLDFSDMPFTNAYGAGNLNYMPEGATKDAWGYDIEEDEYDEDHYGQWRSSGSDGC